MRCRALGKPNVHSSDSNFNHVADVCSSSCGEVEEMSSSTPASHGELPFDHVAAGLAVFGGCSALLQLTWSSRNGSSAEKEFANAATANRWTAQSCLRQPENLIQSKSL